MPDCHCHAIIAISLPLPLMFTPFSPFSLLADFIIFFHLPLIAIFAADVFSPPCRARASAPLCAVTMSASAIISPFSCRRRATPCFRHDAFTCHAFAFYATLFWLSWRWH